MPQPPNLGALLQQAQKMQEEMMAAQEKLKDERIEASAGGGMVKVVMSGDLELKSKNDSSTPHNIALEGNGVNEEGPVVQGGQSSDIKVTLKPGEYTFFCSVPGHREGGMEGKLTVKG